ncbi:D-2-hydroxyacid dehydrogenase [Ruminiclostridium cellulolyticum]|uniref:D-isomer specific 2-hydroxyacid dehydrogenase NAD-binding n=1 Tax=Ruminiclostridium cellulolyticum (strain ATCC 35319 / DSM 5812 / JCM 6584 / H10) TaxID=394503 RepID=B8I1S8_RUMCH|nr:D-2-hydroxyacid dehydrogenase [Ruminiclostridium cellulolyticum]ACL77713.1 D-isomer specific 2-hydroxyacid dehydrogenase NAD-binding [Ruminiclostridium cellulolyticum H10]
MKIVVLDGYTLNPGDISWDAMGQLGELVVYDRTPAEKIIERIDNAEIVLTNKVNLTKDILEKTPSVKYIGVMATGYNVVDTEYAKEIGIVVTNVPAYSTDSVAQLVFAFILEFCHHVGEHSRVVHEGKWTKSHDFSFWDYPLIEIKNKTLGIIGFGAIGQKVAQIACAFGMEVLCYSRTQKPDYENENIKFAPFDDVLAKSDFISLHCPLTEETKGLINKKAISKMKEGAFLINTSRGPVINEQNVAEALNTGRLAGLGTDVVSVEPIQVDNPLLSAKNCIITPHFAWAPKEARNRLMNTLISNIIAFIEKNPVNVVNR